MSNLSNWNRLSILSILFFLGNIIRVNWALIPIFILMNDKFSVDQIIYSIIGISLFVMISAVLRYLFFSFRFTDSKVEIKKGVFGKKALSISYDRIQTVNFKQNILFQIFNVVTLECDTAGSAKQEVKLPAVDRRVANEIKRLIDAYKKEKKVELEQHEEEKAEDSNILLNYDFKELFKIGLTSNRIFIALAGVLTIFNSFSEQLRDIFGYDLEAQVENYASSTTANWDFSIYIIVSVIFLLLMFALSIAASIITLFGFKLVFNNKIFKKSFGLLTRRELQLSLNKVQSLEIKQFVLQKWLGFQELFLKQASSGVKTQNENQFKQAIFNIPHANDQDQAKLLKLVFNKSEFSDFHKLEVNYLFRNRLFFAIIPFLLINAALFFVIDLYSFLIWLLIFPFEILLRKRFNKWGYIIDEDAVVIRYGWFSNSYKIFYTHKIQQIAIEQSPYYHRKDLAKIKFVLASASYTIPYISISFGKKIMDQILFQVESKNKAWM